MLPSVSTTVPWDESDAAPAKLFDRAHAPIAASIAAEKILALSDADTWTILRTAILESPKDPDPNHTRWFVERILFSDVIYLPDGDEQPYRHLHTADLASAILTILKHPRAMRRVLHVCSDEVLTPSIHTLLVSEVLSKPIDLQFVDEKAWELAGISRPMAGRSGAALLAQSTLLYELGWRPTEAKKSMRALCLDLAKQTKRLDIASIKREASLGQPRNEQDACMGWCLCVCNRNGPSLLLRSANQEPHSWRTSAIGIGEESVRMIAALVAAGVQRPFRAPMLARSTQTGEERLVIGQITRDSVADESELIQVPQILGMSALLAVPLARLLENWPSKAPEGEVCILGRGTEALMAYWLAVESGRKAYIVSSAAEQVDGLPKIYSLHTKPFATAAIVVNVSGLIEWEAVAKGMLINGGVLLSPFPPTKQLVNGCQFFRIPDVLRPGEVLNRALEMLCQWHPRLESYGCIAIVDGLAKTPILLSAPALRLLVLKCADLP